MELQSIISCVSMMFDALADLRNTMFEFPGLDLAEVRGCRMSSSGWQELHSPDSVLDALDFYDPGPWLGAVSGSAEAQHRHAVLEAECAQVGTAEGFRV